MAFNPFDVFRRNQKILFACLTVVVMFMFVLSFGQGDFFTQVPRWLSQNRKTGTVLAELDGLKVYSSELEQTRGERVLANQYMFAAAARGADALATYIKDNMGRASAENKPAFEGILNARQQLPLLNSPEAQNPQFRFIIDQIRQQIGQSFARIEGILQTKSPQGADLELAQTAKLMIGLSDLTAAARRAHYFVNQPNDTNRDVMDFILWQRKADQLGIRLDDKAVSRLANDEFYGRLTDDDWRTAENAVRGKNGYSPAVLRRALAEEFRVRAAQAAVMGSQAIKAGGPLADAPYDYFKFYREQTNTARYGLVTVPADNYLDKVTVQPTETELRDLFNKARTVEPDPRRPEIGLKEPRRVKLGFVEITGGEPFYKTKAEAAVKAAEAALDPASPVAAAAGALAGPAVLAGAEGPVKRQYARYKLDHNQQVLTNWATPTPFGGGKPLDTHILEPLNIAAMTAAFAAGGPLTAASVLISDGYASDRIAKLESILPNMIAPVGPGSSALAGVLGAAGGYEAFVRPSPLAAVRGVLTDRAREEVARQAAGDDMQTFGTELAKLGTKPAEAEARVEAFAKERGLTLGGSATLHDQFSLNADPGLKPLNDRFQADAAARFGFAGGYIDPLAFGQTFFYEMDPLGGGRPRASTGLYKPQAYPDGAQFTLAPGRPAFLVWRTADVPAESPRTLDDPTKNVLGQTAREKTVLAWKRLKARELARKEAEELAKRAGGFGPSSVEIEMKLRDEAAKLSGQFPTPEAKNRVQYHEIDRVAPLVSDLSMLPGRGGVGPFQLGPSAFMPYPSQAIFDVLMNNRAKPPATAAAAADNPGDRVYAIVLVQKSDSSADVFGLTVYGPAAQTQFNELARVVQQSHQQEVRRETRERAVSLLKADLRYDKESDDLSKRADQFSD